MWKIITIVMFLGLAIGAQATLWEYYNGRGVSMPSIESRGLTYHDLGLPDKYVGSAKQNERLLDALIQLVPPENIPVGGVSGGVSSASFFRRSGNTIVSIFDDANWGIGTTTAGSTFDFAIEADLATSTLYLVSTDGRAGGCLQIEGTGSTTFHAYATTSGPLILNAGPCRK